MIGEVDVAARRVRGSLDIELWEIPALLHAVQNASQQTVSDLVEQLGDRLRRMHVMLDEALLADDAEFDAPLVVCGVLMDPTLADSFVPPF